MIAVAAREVGMDEDSRSGLKTVGVGTFAEGEGGVGTERLFRVEPGHGAAFVLEQVSIMIGVRTT